MSNKLPRDLSEQELKDIFPSVLKWGVFLESQSLDFEMQGTYSEEIDSYSLSLHIEGDDKELLLNIYNALKQAGEKVNSENSVIISDNLSAG